MRRRVGRGRRISWEFEREKKKLNAYLSIVRIFGLQGIAGNSSFVAALTTNPAFIASVATNKTFTASLATNASFVTAVAGQIISGSNNYGIAVKQNQSLGFPSIPVLTITPGLKHTNIVTSSSGLPVTQSVANTAVATISNNVLTILGAGTTTVTATQSGNNLWNPVSVTQPLIVSKANQTISFPTIPAVSFASTPVVAVSATSSASLPITYVVANTAIAKTRTSNSITIIGTGTTTVTATNAGNAYFNPAGATQTLIVK